MNLSLRWWNQSCVTLVEIYYKRRSILKKYFNANEWICWLESILSRSPFNIKMKFLIIIFVYNLNLSDIYWLISIKYMTVEFCGLIGTHSNFNFIHFFDAYIVLLVKFPWLIVLFDEIFKMIYILFCFPSACLNIPIEPLDKIIFFTILLLHVKYFLNFIETIIDILLLDLIKFVFFVVFHQIKQ
jgi:hypothetical protein